MSASAAYLRKLDRQKRAGSTPSGPSGDTKRAAVVKTKDTVRLLSKALINGFVSKYQNRRSQLLKAVNPMRSPITISRLQTKSSILSNNQRMRLHDIVSIIDSHDNATKFYGQINAFVTDSYAKNYVFLVWLVPKCGRADVSSSSSAAEFSPVDYVHGIAEERPIPAECCTFESTCPMLPRYMHDWSREQLAHEQRRAELTARVGALRAVAPPELANLRSDFLRGT